MKELKIKELREERGLSQAELAQIMGVSVQTVRNWEDGKKISGTASMKLKQVFGIDGVGDVVGNGIGNTNTVTKSDPAVVKALDALGKSQDQIDRLLAIIEKLTD